MPLAQARADLRPSVRGMVDVTGRVIYTHRNLHAAQRRFVAFHELGHYVLPGTIACCKPARSPTSARRRARPGSGRPTCSRWPACSRATFTRRRGAALWLGGGAPPRPALRIVAGSRRPAVRDQPRRTRPVPGGRARRRGGKNAGGHERRAVLEVRYTALSPAWRRRYGAAALPPPGTPLPWTHPADARHAGGRRRHPGTPLAGPLDTRPDLPVQAELLTNGYEVLMLARAAE